jgi:hypothetical protein
VLDQLSDTDSELRPKSPAQSTQVEGAARHLSQEDLESYANGRLASARLSYCRAHLDSCDACRAELEDIRTFASESLGFARAEPSGRAAERRKGQRKLTVPQIISVAAVAVLAVGAVLWWSLERARANKAVATVSVAGSRVRGAPPIAQSGQPAQVIQTAATQTPRITPTPQVAPSPRVARAPQAGQAAPTASATPTTSARSVASAAPPTARVQTPAAQLADEIAALPDDVRSSVSDAIQHRKLQLPTDISEARARMATISGTTQADNEFALLGPFGEATSDTRPEFSWQPLPGAVKYSVRIVDTGLHPVQHSPALRKTVWRPRRPLRRGRTYLWQVTATLRGGSKVVASRPSPSETLLRVIPPKLADELAHFRQSHPEAHLVLGALYAQAGMLTEGADELKQVSPGDSSYNTARALLQSLSPQRAREPLT